MPAMVRNAVCLLAACVTMTFLMGRSAYVYYLWMGQEESRYVEPSALLLNEPTSG
ncbi:MAG: hypothetical protein U5R49_04765 [Deltaproteobacteria bacterium]|nr:hypothetical protein [Deltaproteobacteria bacterium]